METGTKRKRDLDCPRITFHAPDRTFERLLREDSLKELKNTIRAKLGLEPGVAISLSQIRGNSVVVLEDEDDFDAFYNVLHSSNTATVRVTTDKATTDDSSRVGHTGQTSIKKKQKLDSALRSSPAPPRTTETTSAAASASASAPTSRKRAVSFAPPVTGKSTGEEQSSVPPTKRAKTTPTGTQSDAEPAQSGEPSSVAPRSQKDTNPPSSASLAPEPSSTAPAQKTDAEGKKIKKKKAGSDTKSETTVPAKDASEKLNARAIEMAKEGTKKKQPAIQAASGISTPTSEVAVAPPVKESIPAEGASQKESKVKKIKSSALAESSHKDSASSEYPKKRPRSKSTTRRPTTTSAVDFETNDQVSPAQVPQINDSLTTMSRLMIQKYLTPAPSTDNAVVPTPLEEFSEAESTPTLTAPPKVEIPKPVPASKPMCLYCGKVLTHDRSHCPMIRAKNTDVIEKRIADLREETSGVTDDVRANAIEALELASLRAKHPKGASSNVSSSERFATKHVSSSKPADKIVTPSSTSKPASTTCPSPSTSPDTSSDEDVPLRRTSHKLASKTSLPAKNSHKNILPPSKLSLPLSPSPEPEATPKATPASSKVVPLSTRTNDDSEAESSSEDQALQPPAKIRTKAVSSTETSDDETSNSSEDESRDVPKPPHLPQPSRILQPAVLPSTDISDHSVKALEALIRGPSILLKSVELPSSESSEDEDANDIQLENESEEEELRGRSRKTRRSYAPSNDSSDEEMAANDENEDDAFSTPSSRASIPPPVTNSREIQDEYEQELHPVPDLIPEHPPQGEASFQEMDRRLSSVEADKVGNEAFEEVLAEEDTILDPGRKASPQPTSKTPLAAKEPLQVSSGPARDNGAEKQKQVSAGVEAKEPGDPANGAIPEDVEAEAEPAQASGTDPIEAAETLEDATIRQKSPIEVIEDQEAPSTPSPAPPAPPREEPAREATPKPGIVKRMRSRVGLVSPPKKQASSSNLNSNSTVAPIAKPRSTRAITFRSQQGDKAKDPRVGSEHEESHGDADAAPSVVTAGKRASRKRAVSSTSKPLSSRTKVAAEKSMETDEDNEEEPDPPPRRSTRATSKAAASTPKIPVTPHLNGFQTPARTRQTKTVSVTEVVKGSSQPPTKKLAKETKKSKKGEAKAAAKLRTPSPTNEDTELNTSQSQTTELDVPLPPSPPMSLDTWETMRPETPAGTTASDVMVDELQSDTEPIPFSLKPQFQRKSAAFGRKQSVSRLKQAIQASEDHGKGKAKAKTPLFIPSESQTTFPYSQYQTQGSDPVVSDSEEEEEEVRATVVKKPPASQPQPTRYRKLSDFASKASMLFTPTILRQSTGLLQNTVSVPTKRKDRLNQLYGVMRVKNGGDESDDDSDKGSDSDAEKISHIPKSRKAGAAPKGRKSVD